MKVGEGKEALFLPIEQPLNKLSILSIVLFVLSPGSNDRQLRTGMMPEPFVLGIL